MCDKHPLRLFVIQRSLATKNLVDIHVYVIEILPPFGRLDDKRIVKNVFRMTPQRYKTKNRKSSISGYILQENTIEKAILQNIKKITGNREDDGFFAPPGAVG